ncbi:hypothetical protein PC9H_002710 [Pleurotus ostreatus]|uniref:Uncharacterized protein n=2 Tax=Pleurotus TaxID=5320 RepID=A0A8H7DMG3_PLEOS|nr:uncharacterized protein PC9H_002710 [Pleurotus ostreatus]KAF7416444.1 hypothetical protein PC9H_002710 [Pleurotus ostreatus]KAG9225306.1 hypothetical protein CCMSSC00406_0009862 [Pleurotus cornucopiae]
MRGLAAWEADAVAFHGRTGMFIPTPSSTSSSPSQTPNFPAYVRANPRHTQTLLCDEAAWSTVDSRCRKYARRVLRPGLRRGAKRSTFNVQRSAFKRSRLKAQGSTTLFTHHECLFVVDYFTTSAPRNAAPIPARILILSSLLHRAPCAVNRESPLMPPMRPWRPEARGCRSQHESDAPPMCTGSRIPAESVRI